MSDSKQQLAELYPHPTDLACTIYEAEGQRWVKHHELIEGGYSHLEDFSIVYIDGRFYELQGHTRAAQRILGRQLANEPLASYPDAGIWWIEEVEEAA